MNTIMLVGRLASEPELTQTTKGTDIVKFSLAVRKDKEKTNFFNCVAFGSTARFIDQYFHKGDQMATSGEMNCDVYDKDGKKQYWWSVGIERANFVGGKRDGGKQPQTQKSDDNITINEGEWELPF